MPAELGQITQETIDQTKQILGGLPRALKSISVGVDVLYGYPLEAPSKKLYPIEDTMRRRVPRFLNPVGGTYAHWKQVTAINASKVKAGVAEGAIGADITLTDADKSAAYKTLSMTGKYTEEARVMGRKFEDIPAYTMLTTLQSLMIQEDRYIIGGNQVALGAVAGLAAADSDLAGGLTGATAYDFKVSALTLQGYLNGAKGIVGAADSPDETVGTALTTFTTGAGKTSVDLTWTDKPGAFAYNVFITLHAGAYKWQKTVTVNKAHVDTIAAGNAANAADQTADILGYSGILEQLNVALSGAYYATLNAAAMSGDGAAGVTEIETLLQSIWNSARISPTVFLVNAQESKSLKKLIIGSSGTNATRITVAMDGQTEFKGGSGVQSYWNPYTAQFIPVITSIHMPAGKIIAIGERVPYPNSETPNNLEVELQQEYYGEEFAKVDRTQKMAVTCMGALKVYFPPACGVIANIIAS